MSSGEAGPSLARLALLLSRRRRCRRAPVAARHDRGSRRGASVSRTHPQIQHVSPAVAGVGRNINLKADCTARERRREAMNEWSGGLRRSMSRPRASSAGARRRAGARPNSRNRGSQLTPLLPVCVVDRRVAQRPAVARLAALGAAPLVLPAGDEQAGRDEREGQRASVGVLQCVGLGWRMHSAAQRSTQARRGSSRRGAAQQ